LKINDDVGNYVGASDDANDDASDYVRASNDASDEMMVVFMSDIE
jgi:hypothetical protein